MTLRYFLLEKSHTVCLQNNWKETWGFFMVGVQTWFNKVSGLVPYCVTQWTLSILLPTPLSMTGYSTKSTYPTWGVKKLKWTILSPRHVLQLAISTSFFLPRVKSVISLKLTAILKSLFTYGVAHSVIQV